MPLAQFLGFQRQLWKRYIYLTFTNGTVRQQDTSFESVCVCAGTRLAAHKTTATLKGASGPQVNNSVSLITLPIYSLEISDLKISCCGWGRGCLLSHPLWSQVQQRSQLLCSRRIHSGGQVWRGKRGVRFISADEKKQKRGVSSFPRWVGLSGVAERGAGMPLVPGRADRRLGLTPLAILVLSAVIDTITKRNWGRKVLSVLRHSLSAKKARGETQGCG